MPLMAKKKDNAMNYCCENIRKAHELIVNAARTLNWSNDLNIGDGILGGLTLGIWSTARTGKNLNEAENKMRNAYNYLREAEREINSCNCWTSFKVRESELVGKHNTLVGEWNEMKDKYNGMIDRLNSNIADYNRLIGKHGGLEDKYDDLEGRHNRLNRDIRELRDKYESERQTWQEKAEAKEKEHKIEADSLRQDVLRLTRSEERYRQGALAEQSKANEINRRLTNAEKISEKRNERILALTNQMNDETKTLTTQIADLQVKKTRNETALWFRENELTQTQNQLETCNNQLESARNLVLVLHELLSDLQVKNSSYDSEIARLEKELDAKENELTERITPLELQDLMFSLNEKDEKIEELTKQKEKLKQDDLTKELNENETELAKFIEQLGISEENEIKIEELIEANKKLIQAENSGNVEEFEASQASIKLVERNLRRQEKVEFSPINQLSKKIALLRHQRLELVKQKQPQHQAHIQVPPRN